MRLKLIQAPFSESPADLPVTVSEAKEHSRITTSSDDAYIEQLIMAAAQYAQERTGCAIGVQVWEGALNSFFADCSAPYAGYSRADVICLPLPPLNEVLSVKYTDANGDEQTLDAALYVVDTFGVKASIRRAFGEVWPATRCEPDAVRIRFSCGYSPNGSPAPLALPPRLRQAVLVMVNEMYDNRTDGVDDLPVGFRGAIDALLRPSRVDIW